MTISGLSVSIPALASIRFDLTTLSKAKNEYRPPKPDNAPMVSRGCYGVTYSGLSPAENMKNFYLMIEEKFGNIKEPEWIDIKELNSPEDNPHIKQVMKLNAPSTRHILDIQA